MTPRGADLGEVDGDDARNAHADVGDDARNARANEDPAVGRGRQAVSMANLTPRTTHTRPAVTTTAKKRLG